MPSYSFERQDRTPSRDLDLVLGWQELLPLSLFKISTLLIKEVIQGKQAGRDLAAHKKGSNLAGQVGVLIDDGNFPGMHPFVEGTDSLT